MSVTFWQAILLGALQGLTEFLPVSSSAHLILAQRLLPGFSQPGILFDVMLHVGTLVAVVVYFREKIGGLLRGAVSRDPASRRASWKMALMLAVSVGLTGALTLPLKQFALDGMDNLPRMGVALLATSLLLAGAQAVGARRGEGGRSLEEMRVRDAVLIGAFQSFSALFRGLSRSGNTISMGLFAGLSRRAAAEYAFLLSVPTILAAALVENVSEYRATGHLVTAGSHVGVYLSGMVVAALVGYVAVAALLRLVVSMKLQPFIVYTALLGIAVLAAGLL
ncbi:MAG: undecaprenyl-diphosphate phosphatase [Holophagales bacterium]|nr:undecaprenyl-diphosphate phosphatase [Holophagales bacterium]